MPTTAFNPSSLTFRPTLPPPWVNNLEQNSQHFYISAGNASSPGSSGSDSSASSQSSYNENSNSPLRSPDTTTYEEFNGEDRPYLMIIEQPNGGFRFRYKTEMQGTHGAILGTQSKKNCSKTCPKVKLCNYKQRPGESLPIIRCTLCTADPDETRRILHVHRLVSKMSGKERDDPHDIQVKAPDYTAHFQQMTILYTKKEHQLEVVLEKKKYHTKRRFTDSRHNYLIPDALLAKTSEEIKNINFHVACLRFEALIDNGKGKYVQLCPPVYSNNINNLKNPQTSELKICRVDQCMGPCQGGQEVFMFVEKVVKKNIKVKFYEEDEQSNIIWEDYAVFKPDDVHHQYGIVFKTPPYKKNIKESEGNVTVYYQLERPSDNAVSEPRKYEYTPNPNHTPDLPRKIPRHRAPLFPTTLPEHPGTSNRNNHTYQPPVCLPKEPLTLLLPVTEHKLADVTCDPEISALSINDHLPDLSNYDNLLQELFENDPAMETSSMPLYEVATQEKPFNIVSSFTQALHQMPQVDSEVCTDFFASDRFCDYLKAIGEDGYADELMSQEVSSSDNREHNVTDGCTVATARHQSIVDSFRQPARIPKTSTYGTGNRRGEQKSARDSLTKSNIVERVEKSVNVLVQQWRSRRIETSGLRDYLDRLIRFATIVHTGDSVLHVLATTENLPLPPQVEKFIHLLKNQGILNALELKNKKQETPLLVAARWGVPDMVSLLVSAGASVTATDSDYNTALHMAVMRDSGGLEVLSALLPHYSDITTTNKDGLTALHLAVQNRKPDIVSCLCVKSDNGLYQSDVINCEDKKHGNTALHLAVRQRYRDIVNLLLNFEQLNVNAKNFADKTPLAFVWNECDKEAEDIREALLANKADPSLVDSRHDSKKGKFKNEENNDSDDDALHTDESEGIDESLSAYAREWDFTALFDTKTVSKLCPLLDRNKDWQDLGKRLNFKKYELEYCNNYWSSSLLLFRLVSTYRPDVTAETIRDHLLHMSPHLHVGAQYIDDMELEKMGM